RQIHVALFERLLGLACGSSEQRIESVIGHTQAGTVVEIGLVQPKRAVWLEIDQPIENESSEFGLAVWREPHHFIFTRIHLEAGVVSKCRIKQPERVRKMQFLAHLQMIAASEPNRRGRPLAYAIHGEDDRLVER